MTIIGFGCYREWRTKNFRWSSVDFWRRVIWPVETRWEFWKEGGERLLHLRILSRWDLLNLLWILVRIWPIESFGSWFVGGSLGFIGTLVIHWNSLGLLWRKWNLFVIYLLFTDVGYTVQRWRFVSVSLYPTLKVYKEISPCCYYK